MKVVLVCKSDTVGGAAVVTMRLMSALRDAGIDARMLVADKRSDSVFVDVAASKQELKRAFIAERLKIFLLNGFDRKNLFKIDTASDGVDITSHPAIQEADIVCLNWVNQGFLSFKDIRRLHQMGKKIVWTMHDMWNMTGICHHAYDCNQYLDDCHHCPLLSTPLACKQLAHRIWQKKQKLYTDTPIHFVAVSRWLAERARASSLLRNAPISVIPNAFPFGEPMPNTARRRGRIIFGGARIDDPLKGLDTLIVALRIIKEKHPSVAEELELITYGSIRNPELLDNVPIAHRHLGVVAPSTLPKLYAEGSIVVSASDWETLPGTLIEGQAYGCIPVALEHGGQADIIEHLKTGWLAPFGTRDENAARIAEGIIWAHSTDAEPAPTHSTDAEPAPTHGTDVPQVATGTEIRTAMRRAAIERFDAAAVAAAYIRLFASLSR